MLLAAASSQRRAAGRSGLVLVFNHWPMAFRRTLQSVLLERFVAPVFHGLLSFPEHIIALHGVLAQKLEVFVRDDVPVASKARG